MLKFNIFFRYLCKIFHNNLHVLTAMQILIQMTIPELKVFSPRRILQFGPNTNRMLTNALLIFAIYLCANSSNDDSHTLFVRPLFSFSNMAFSKRDYGAHYARIHAVARLARHNQRNVALLAGDNVPPADGHCW